jgi:hypothetical protein
MQMLYFADPELVRRAAISPPSRPQEQIIEVRTDPAEFISDDEFSSELERGFVEELRRS